MSNELVERFFSDATTNFRFLENKYGYKLVKKAVRNKERFPDSEAVIQYIGPSIAIEIFWYFASAVIGVAFFKLEKGEVPKSPDIINLYAIANYLCGCKEDMFVLKDTLNTRMSKIKTRERIINSDLSGVIQNLASGMQKYAINIIRGDTEIFMKSREILEFSTFR